MSIRKLTGILAFVLITFNCLAQSNGVPAGMLIRTLYIKAGSKTGTSFLIDYKGKSYLITAKHVVSDLPRKNATFQIFQLHDWKDVTADVMQPKNDEVDIAVLDPHWNTTPSDWNPELSSAGVNIGGQVYFLGYPFGLHGLFHAEYVPFVKHGVYSAVDGSDDTAVRMYVDGFNNEGFSGGPIVAFSNQKWQILGVIKGYYEEAAKTKLGGQSIDTKILVNSGILVGYSIKHALEAIDNTGAATSPK